MPEIFKQIEFILYLPNSTAIDLVKEHNAALDKEYSEAFDIALTLKVDEIFNIVPDLFDIILGKKYFINK
jgi:hypothetical protein